MGEVVWINGRVFPRDEARISVFDHGFLYGDSIYETIRTSRGVPFLLDRHLDRLRRSAEAIELKLDRSPDQYCQAVEATHAASGNPDSALRMVVSRGVGDIGYEPSLCPSPSTLIYARPMRSIRDPRLRRGVRVAILDILRNDRRALSPSIKSGNLLNNILGAFEAQRKGVDEGVMLNRDGQVAEGTMTNIFMVKDGVIRTAPLDAGILPGITRGFVLELARETGLPAEETLFGPDAFRRADEAFLTGTTRGILSIVAIDGSPVAGGAPGPVTRQLTAIFDEAEDRFVARAGAS
jgi:branched-chain amino acid aminotransferase